MKVFRYTVMTKDGERVNGVLRSNSEEEAMALLREENHAVLALKLIRNEVKKQGFLSMNVGGNKLNGKAFVLMCSEFATILGSGLPISRAVHLIAEKTTDKTLKLLLENVAQDVDSGISLSASFADHGRKILPPTFVDTLRAGEESGDLSRSFRSIYKYFDSQSKSKGKVKKAMGYPLFVLGIAVVVVIILMVKVVPAFLNIFEGQGRELPAMTQALIAMSNGTKTYWFPAAVSLIVLFMAVKFWDRTEAGHIKMAQLKLLLPVIGKIEELNAASQFSNTMATMVSAGIPLTRALEITSKVISNALISRKIRETVGKVEQGHTVSSSMREIKELPDILTDLVAVGEETGEMQDTLDTIAKYYDQELDVAISGAISKIEPALLIFLAVFVGFIVIAIYMSMFTMYEGM